MATLTGQSVASSYEQLLHVDRDGGGNTTTLVNVKDGDNGTTFALQLASDNIQVNGNTVITTADNTDTLTLISTDADANVGPNLRLYRNSADPADADILGEISFAGEDSAGNADDYGRITVENMGPTSGSENAKMVFRVLTGGTERAHFVVDRTEVAVNEDSQDIDFRVESDVNTHALFVQGSDGNVGIGTTAPTSTLTFGATSTISTATTDSSDSDVLTISGGGAGGRTRGGTVYLYGNEHANTGQIILDAGDISNGDIIFKVNGGTVAMTIDQQTNGNVGIGDTSPSHKLDVAGGIVEQGGVLKENLLTNSGFDVWSNSTLLEATGGAAPVLDGAESALTNNLVSKGAFDSGGGVSPWTSQQSGALASVTSGKTGYCLQITSGSGGNDWARSGAITTVVGKLYQFTAYVKAGTEATYQIMCGTANGTGAYIDATGEAAGDWSTVATVVFEATTTSTHISLRVMGSEGTTMFFDSVTLYEVTPGCVGDSDALMADGWVKGVTANNNMYRQHSDGATEAVTKLGSFYSLKATGSANNADVYFPGPSGMDLKPSWYSRFAGRTFTFGAWVKSAEATIIKLFWYQPSSYTYTSANAGTGWEWIEITGTVADGAAQFFVGFNIVDTKTVYISQPMLVFGSSIGEGNYTRPQGEVVSCEKMIRTHAGVTPAAADDGIQNLEALSSGMIPKGAKAVNMRVDVNNSSITSQQGIGYGRDSTYWYQVIANPVVNNVAAQAEGLVTCDANGDIYQNVSEAGATLSGLYVDINAIYLR